MAVGVEHIALRKSGDGQPAGFYALLGQSFPSDGGFYSAIAAQLAYRARSIRGARLGAAFAAFTIWRIRRVALCHRDGTERASAVGVLRRSIAALSRGQEHPAQS